MTYPNPQSSLVLGHATSRARDANRTPEMSFLRAESDVSVYMICL